MIERRYSVLALAGALCLAAVGCRSELGVSPASGAASSVAARSETLKRVYGVVAEQMVIDPATLTPETTLADLQMDELDYVETVMSIEESFGVSISDADAEAEMLQDDFDESFRSVTLADLAGRVDRARSVNTP